MQIIIRLLKATIYYPIMIPIVFVLGVCGLFGSVVYWIITDDFETPSAWIEDVLEKMLLVR